MGEYVRRSNLNYFDKRKLKLQFKLDTIKVLRQHFINEVNGRVDKEQFYKVIEVFDAMQTECSTDGYLCVEIDNLGVVVRTTNFKLEL